MAPSRLREALGAVKDQASIGLARMGSADEVAADLDVAIVKATEHGDSFAADQRHVQEILTLTHYSRARVAACVASVSRRLGRTRAWGVAVKALALLHRLLDDGDPAFEQEVFLATRRGRRLLDMSRFRDRSRSWGFSAFVRAYAAYLDDRLKHRMQRGGGTAASPRKWRLDADGDAWVLAPRETPAPETTPEELIAKAQHLKHLLDRFVACRPVGKAKANRVVRAALYALVKESVAMYCELTEVMAVLVDRFAELETPCCVRVHSVFTTITKLVDELDDFYSWCKLNAVCRPFDVPEVEHVTQKKLDLMDEFIRDRQSSAAAQRKRSPESAPSPAPSSSWKDDASSTKPVPAPKELQVAAQEGKNPGKAPPAEPARALAVAADDQMADFLNLEEEDTSPAPPPALSGEEHGRSLALALFAGAEAEPAPRWEAFDADDPSPDWETALVQSASMLACQRAELGGGFNATLLDGMYTHEANARAFAASGSGAAMRQPGSTALALPPPPAAAAARADPFAASLAVPPPTYVQMMEMHTRQRLLAQEQMAWLQHERHRATWSYNNLLL